MGLEEPRVCIADRIGNYINKFFQSEKLTLTTEQLNRLKSTTNEVYQNIRGEIFINGKDPRLVAAGIIHFATRKENMTDILRIHQIGRIMNTSFNPIHYSYRRLVIHFYKSKNQLFEERYLRNLQRDANLNYHWATITDLERYAESWDG